MAIVEQEQNLAINQVESSTCNDESTLVEVDEYFNLAKALCYVEGNGDQGTGFLYKLPKSSNPNLQFTKKEYGILTASHALGFKHLTLNFNNGQIILHTNEGVNDEYFKTQMKNIVKEVKLSVQILNKDQAINLKEFRFEDIIDGSECIIGKKLDFALLPFKQEFKLENQELLKNSLELKIDNFEERGKVIIIQFPQEIRVNRESKFNKEIGFSIGWLTGLIPLNCDEMSNKETETSLIPQLLMHRVSTVHCSSGSPLINLETKNGNQRLSVIALHFSGYMSSFNQNFAIPICFILSEFRELVIELNPELAISFELSRFFLGKMTLRSPSTESCEAYNNICYGGDSPIYSHQILSQVIYAMCTIQRNNQVVGSGFIGKFLRNNQEHFGLITTVCEIKTINADNNNMQIYSLRFKNGESVLLQDLVDEEKEKEIWMSTINCIPFKQEILIGSNKFRTVEIAIRLAAYMPIENKQALILTTNFNGKLSLLTTIVKEVKESFNFQLEEDFLWSRHSFGGVILQMRDGDGAMQIAEAIGTIANSNTGNYINLYYARNFSLEGSQQMEEELKGVEEKINSSICRVFLNDDNNESDNHNEIGKGVLCEISYLNDSIIGIMWSYSSQIAKNYKQSSLLLTTNKEKISGNHFPNLTFEFKCKSIKSNPINTPTLVYLKEHNVCFVTLCEEPTDLRVLKITEFFIEEDDELHPQNELFYMVQGDTAKGQHYQIQKVHNLTDERKSAKLVTFITNGPRTPLLSLAPLVFNALGNVVGILTQPIGDSLTQFECRQLASNIDKDIIELIKRVPRHI